MEELTVANLICDVEKKKFLLPTIQRGFVWDAKKIETPQKLYLNLLKINADSDVGDDDAGLDNVYDFKFLTPDDAAKRDAETFWFPVGKILDKEFEDSVNIADFLIENNLVDSNTHSYLKLPYKILNRLWHSINVTPSIEYHLKKSKNLDEVLNIFVRINNGGKPVELSELLISLATAQLKNFDFENKLIDIVNEVNKIGGEKNFNVSNDWAIKSAVALVNEFGFNQKNFASNNALIPLAQYIYLKGNNPAAYAADKGKMLHWFISATLNGVFSHSTDATLIKLRNQLNDNHENFPIFEMLDAKDKSEEKIADETKLQTEYEKFFNALPNLQLLSSAENKKKRGTFFSDWIAAKSDEERAVKLSPDNSNSFVIKRQFENIKFERVGRAQISMSEGIFYR